MEGSLPVMETIDFAGMISTRLKLGSGLRQPTFFDSFQVLKLTFICLIFVTLPP